MPGLSHTAARGAVTTFMGQWSRFVLQILSVAVLARLLSPDDYGRIAMVTAISGIAILLGDFGLSTASIQATKITRNQRSNLFWINMAVGVVCCALVAAAAHPIAAFYGDEQLTGIAIAVGIVFLTEAAGSQFRAESSRSFRFGWLAATDITSQAVGLAAAVACVFLHAGFWALVVQQIAVSACKLVMLVFATPWRPGLPHRGEQMKGLLTFGVNTLGVQAVNYVSSNADTVMIGKFLGAGPLGIYSRAFQLFRLPLQQIAQPLSRVALPVLSRLQDDNAAFERYVLRGQKLLSYLFGGAFLIGVAVSTPLIDVLLGSRWHGAATVFLILCIGGIFQAMGYVFYWVLLARALTRLQLKFSILTRILMVGLMLGGLHWGINGVALGSTLGLALNWFVFVVFALPRADIRVGPIVRVAFKPLWVFGPMIAIVYPLCWVLTPRIGSIATLAIALVVVAGILGFAFRFIPTYRDDASQIVDTAKRARRTPKPAAGARPEATDSTDPDGGLDPDHAAFEIATLDSFTDGDPFPTSGRPLDEDAEEAASLLPDVSRTAAPEAESSR